MISFLSYSFYKLIIIFSLLYQEEKYKFKTRKSGNLILNKFEGILLPQVINIFVHNSILKLA